MSFADTSLTLLQQVQHNDPAAWTRFHTIYGPLVRYWLKKCNYVSPEDMADLEQEIFLAVSKAITRFRRDSTQGSLRGWLRVITANAVRNFVKRKSRGTPALGGTTANRYLQSVSLEELDDTDETVECGIVMRRATEVLKSEFREATYRAFWMSAVDGLPTDMIALELDTTPQAVRQSCYRVRRRLRLELGEMLD